MLFRSFPLRPAVCASGEGGSLGGHLLRGSLQELRTTQKRLITNEIHPWSRHPTRVTDRVFRSRERSIVRAWHRAVSCIASQREELMGNERGAALRTMIAAGDFVVAPGVFDGISRSEEHTSELQSLMRISYAVFCLKHKKKNH